MFGLTDGFDSSDGVVPNDCLGLDLVASVLTDKLAEDVSLQAMFGARVGRYIARPVWYSGDLPALFVYPFFTDPDYVPGTAEQSEFLFVAGVGYVAPGGKLGQYEPSPLTAAAKVKAVLYANQQVNVMVGGVSTRLINKTVVQRENPVFIERGDGRPNMVIHEIPWLVRACLNPATGQIEEVETNVA